MLSLRFQLKITSHRLIGLVGRVFANGPGDRGSIQIESYQRLKKWYLILFTNPSARAGYDTRSTFKRSLTGLNSEFSFS